VIDMKGIYIFMCLSLVTYHPPPTTSTSTSTSLTTHITNNNATQ
jgi:hypothetical protein